MTNLDSILKSRYSTLPTKVHLVKTMGFPVVLCGCELDHKESWVLKNWCFWTVGVGEDSWESLGLQGDQTSQFYRKSFLNIHWMDWCWSWNSNTLVTWYKELTHWKKPWYWEDWRQEEKGMTEDEMVRWHHRLNGHEIKQLWESVLDREALA